MSSPIPCTPCCDSTNTVNVPGASGGSAYTTTTASFVVPAIAATVAISVGSTAWMAVGQKVFISDGTDFGNFEVQSIGGSTSFVGEFMGYVDDAAPGATVGSGAAVVASGTQSTFTTTALKALNATLLSGINAFTDNTTGTASDTLAAGVGIYNVSAYVDLVNVTGTGNIFYFIPGHAFKVLSITATTEDPESGGPASSLVVTPYVNGVAVTGGLLTLTKAAVAAVGGNISATAVTAANTGTAAQSLNIQCTTYTTAFTDGAVRVVLTVQNMDSANAFASLADKINDIKAALQT